MEARPAAGFRGLSPYGDGVLQEVIGNSLYTAFTTPY
jgi:hypothetical protein